MSGNAIFLTGGTSGIGRGLAEAFYDRGNSVMITGRRADRLKEICDRRPGMRHMALDVTDPAAIQAAARKAIADLPEINCVINNAGIQQRPDFGSDEPLDDQALLQEIQTNLLAPIRVTAAFLPHLKTRPNATLVNVTSGLAFVPLARFPVYCASKAALHSWTLSLRRQLWGSGVQVIELIPPYVATELGGAGKPEPLSAGANQPMPLEAFIAETMQALEAGGDELAIDGAERLAAAGGGERVKQVFAAMNP